MSKYGIVHTTNLNGCATYSFQSNTDLENGTLIAKGDLVEKEREIYVATIDPSKPAFLVANPAWSYDDAYYKNQDEGEYINAKDVAFRGYELKVDRKFRVSINMFVVAESDELAEGDVVGVTSTGKLSKDVADSAFLGKIEKIDTLGMLIPVGSAGNVDNTNKMVVVRVIQNATTTANNG